MRVLIAVDGSSGAFEAIRQLVTVLSPGKDQVALYYSPPDVSASSALQQPEQKLQIRRAFADAILSEARKLLPLGLGETVHTIVGTQDARHGVSIAAEQWQANLIAVGARGLGRLERLLLGSVSRAVVHAAKTPVWIARPKPAERTGFHILLSCENADTGLRSAELLSEFSWPPDTTVQAITVISSLFAGRVPDWLLQQAHSLDAEPTVQRWVQEHDEEIQRNVTSMQQLTKGLPARLPLLSPLVVEGTPAEQILAAINRDKIDLVVIGAKHKRLLASAVFGSTAEAVLNNAQCSVLVVPHREAP
jgi:nucleotide-binding universal stress UspA family protein